MRPKMLKTPVILAAGLVVLAFLAVGASRCSLLGDITISPDDEVAVIGYDVKISWEDDIDSPHFVVGMNNEDISASIQPITGKEAVFELGDHYPGVKMVSATVSASVDGRPWIATETSFHKATSSLARSDIPGAPDQSLVFSCREAFMHLPISIPGLTDTLDDLLLTVFGLMPMGGNFPAGDSSFPTDAVTIAHGIVAGPVFVPLIQYETVFDEDADVSNGLSFGPIEVALTQELLEQFLPMGNGMICELSFLSDGTVYPVDDATGTYCAAMSQTLNQVTVSVMKDDVCTPVYTSPAGTNLLSLNFLAECN